eukprot:Plantae.Rhodophyta-Rhodochaete_pulchella.ctg3514.p1 GENE.Plantae.Rhodophyta-Rhodochaete_pulchella.ctg3514~~Plantae.Rhodophyta-Rhodochaete_pulchella.ctg3514.p1  ORF type:complete len:452 (-),score=51.63 Plantae.Rhodophyta-Rhodochaete_pulchella.ctg3514:118-1473(-)
MKRSAGRVLETTALRLDSQSILVQSSPVLDLGTVMPTSLVSSGTIDCWETSQSGLTKNGREATPKLQTACESSNGTVLQTRRPRRSDGVLDVLWSVDEADGGNITRQLNSGIGPLMNKFCAAIEIKDRCFHLRKYRMCFVGQEAVAWLTTSGVAKSVADAVRLGNKMMSAGVFYHVTHSRPFENRKSFYRLTGDDRKSGTSEGSGGCSLSRTLSDEHELRDSMDMMRLIEEFRHGAEIRDRKFHTKQYRNCFVGCDAVQWLVDAGYARNVDEAVSVGNQMMEQGVFSHVSHDHSFENKFLFYRFEEESKIDRRRLSRSISCWLQKKKPLSQKTEKVVFHPQDLSSDALLYVNTRRNRSDISVAKHLTDISANSSTANTQQDIGHKTERGPGGARGVTFLEESTSSFARDGGLTSDGFSQELQHKRIPRSNWNDEKGVCLRQSFGKCPSERV